MENRWKKRLCRKLFYRLTDPINQGENEVALQNWTFRNFLVLLLDRVNIPANSNLMDRLYSARQIGDFDNLYYNDRGFRNVMQILQKLEECRDCRQLLSRLTDRRLRRHLEAALQGRAFRINLVGLLDELNIPANNNVADRVYSIPAVQINNFDNLYNNDRGFRSMIRALQEVVQTNGGDPFAAVVTPNSSPGGTPQNSPGRNAGNGGDADGAPPAAV